jgi:6,7-dimethyl-8-ribityllumazine synthase
MLTPIQAKRFRAPTAPFAIIASEYNARYVDAMVRAARTELRKAGVKSLRVVRVPGAYEIPLAAARLAAAPAGKGLRPAAIICLGVILRGETVHAAHIGEAVSRAFMDLQLQHGIPIIHEVLLLENEAQARARCLSRTHNRGTEAAQSALAMARVMASLV